MLRLIKAIYSLKQSGREWFGMLLVKLVKHYTQLTFNPCIFVGKHVIITVYIDDILVVGTTESVASFKAMLSEKFKCIDMGLCKYLLGLEINQTPAGISIAQRGYTERVLHQFNMLESNSRHTPMDPNSFPWREEVDNTPVDSMIYQSLTSSVNFLITSTQINLAFPIAVLSTFNAKPTKRHFAIVKGVL